MEVDGVHAVVDTDKQLCGPSWLDPTFLKKLSRATMPATEFGREAFDFSEETSRKAAKNGDIPAIKVGGQYFVVCAKARRMLGLDEAA